MITATFIILTVSHLVAAWLFIRRAGSVPTLGEAYRDETLNRHSDPL